MWEKSIHNEVNIRHTNQDSCSKPEILSPFGQNLCEKKQISYESLLNCYVFGRKT